MPSTHSSAVAFMATYILLASAGLPLPRALGSISDKQEQILRVGGPALAAIWAVVVTASRVSLGHHTLPQILGGIAFGSTFAVGCYYAYVNGLDGPVGVVGARVEEEVLAAIGVIFR